MSTRRALLAVLTLACLLATGCGPSEQQTITFYIQSVTLQERRVQSAAEELDAALPHAEGAVLDLEDARTRARKARETITQTRAETDKLHAPQQVEAYKAEVLKAFDVAGERVEKLLALLDEETQLRRAGAEAAPALRERISAVRGDLADLDRKGAEVDQKMHEEKRKLIDAYALSIPGEDPPVAPSPGGAR